MKRFQRWIVSGLAGVSLLLCMTTCVLSVRSYWVLEEIKPGRSTACALITFKGRIYLIKSQSRSPGIYRSVSLGDDESHWVFNTPNHDFFSDPMVSFSNSGCTGLLACRCG